MTTLHEKFWVYLPTAARMFAALTIVASGIALVSKPSFALGPPTGPLPKVESYSTATSSSVVITVPSGYSGRVFSVYDGTKFNTYATTSPLSDADVKRMRDAMADEQRRMQDLVDAQRKLFDEQFKIFDDVFGSTGSAGFSWNRFWDNLGDWRRWWR